MKPILLIILLLIGACSSVHAQKKSPKKIVRKSQKSFPPPPPPIVKPLKIKSPVTKTVNAKEIDDAPAPMYVESPREKEYNNTAVCTDCDSLTLQTGTPQILIFKIGKMGSDESRTFRKQPVENDLQNSSYALSGLQKREWEELKKHYSEKDFNYKYIYRNTYIKIKNSSGEIVNYLDRRNWYNGFLYWSGNAKDKILTDKKLIKTTEKIAKERGTKEISSYSAKFKNDSLKIADLQITRNPSKDFKPNMNNMLQQIIVGEILFPFPFIEISNVKQINFEDNKADREDFIFKFNTDGQMTEFVDVKDKNSDLIIYKDGLPVRIERDGKIKKRFYYQKDLLSVVTDYNIEGYQLIGKILIQIDSYQKTDRDYAEMTVESFIDRNLVVDGKSICINNKRKDDNQFFNYCYNNSTYEFPFIENYSSDNSQ